MRTIIVVIIAALFLITSCTSVPESISDETIVEEVVEEKETVIEVEEIEEIKETSQATEENKEIIKDLEIAGLVEKSSKVDNYQYLYQKTTSVASTGYKVFYYQGKVLKEYNSPKSVSDALSYTKVYLDLNEKTAFAICDTSSITCKGLRLKIYPINYATEELLFLPHELSKEITADAVKKGDELIEKRNTLLVEYGDTKINLDKFSGVATKYVVDGSEESYSFTQLAINSVKLGDVTLPKGYEMVQS